MVDGALVSSIAEDEIMCSHCSSSRVTDLVNNVMLEWSVVECLASTNPPSTSSETWSLVGTSN